MFLYLIIRENTLDIFNCGFQALLSKIDKFAKKNKYVFSHVTTSARTGLNVNKAFEDAVVAGLNLSTGAEDVIDGEEDERLVGKWLGCLPFLKKT